MVDIKVSNNPCYQILRANCKYQTKRSMCCFNKECKELVYIKVLKKILDFIVISKVC